MLALRPPQGRSGGCEGVREPHTRSSEIPIIQGALLEPHIRASAVMPSIGKPQPAPHSVLCLYQSPRSLLPRRPSTYPLYSLTSNLTPTATPRMHTLDTQRIVLRNAGPDAQLAVSIHSPAPKAAVARHSAGVPISSGDLADGDACTGVASANCRSWNINGLPKSFACAPVRHQRIQPKEHGRSSSPKTTPASLQATLHLNQSSFLSREALATLCCVQRVVPNRC